jgi:hypothetical protein
MRKLLLEHYLSEKVKKEKEKKKISFLNNLLFLDNLISADKFKIS